MKLNKVKYELGLSCVSLLLCVSMLIGTTYAWYTDRATASVDIVQSGNLDIDIVSRLGDGSVLSVKDNTLTELKFVERKANDKIKIIKSEDMSWEPRATYEFMPLTLVNKGNLALKYKVAIYAENAPDASADLAEGLLVQIYEDNAENHKGNGEWVTIGTLRDVISNQDGAAYGYLMPAGDKEDMDEVSLDRMRLCMKENLDQTYAEAELNNMKLIVYASQYAYESDSSLETYDEDAEFDQIVYRNLYTEGENILILNENDITCYEEAGEERNKIHAIVALNDDEEAMDESAIDGEEDHDKKTRLTITGQGNVFANMEEDHIEGLAVYASRDSMITIENGHFANRGGDPEHAYALIYADSNGEIDIKGGTFQCVTPEFTLDLADDSPEARIVVSGGSFYEFEPGASNSEDENITVADGYQVIEEEKEDGIWYTVVPDKDNGGIHLEKEK